MARPEMWRVKILGRRNVRRADAEIAPRNDGARVMQGVADSIRMMIFRMSVPVTNDEREELRWADDGGMGVCDVG